MEFFILLSAVYSEQSLKHLALRLQDSDAENETLPQLISINGFRFIDAAKKLLWRPGKSFIQHQKYVIKNLKLHLKNECDTDNINYKPLDHRSSSLSKYFLENRTNLIEETLKPSHP